MTVTFVPATVFSGIPVQKTCMQHVETWEARTRPTLVGAAYAWLAPHRRRSEEPACCLVLTPRDPSKLVHSAHLRLARVERRARGGLSALAAALAHGRSHLAETSVPRGAALGLIRPQQVARDVVPLP